MKTKLTIAQQDQLLAIDIQHGEVHGFTMGFALLLEEKGADITNVVNYIVKHVKPNRTLRMQLFGVHHNLTVELI